MEDQIPMTAALNHIIHKLSGEERNEISDGYHTFGELYEHRIWLWIALCRGNKEIAWKSLYHSDGSRIEGWFVLGLGKRPGLQMTYHLPLKYWDECPFVEALSRAPDYDGHTSKDVLELLKHFGK